jgi:FlaA1/EpsC-like NDP-sugar epimerase
MMISFRRNMPRWLIFTIDLTIVMFSVVLAYLLRFNFAVPSTEMVQFPGVLAYILAVRAFSFIIMRTYAGIIRYTSTRDAARIFVVTVAGSIILAMTNIVTYYAINRTFFIPFSIIIIEFLASIFVMVTFRMIVKIAWLELVNPSSQKTNVIIYGAGEAGLIAKRAIDRDAGSKYKVLAFIDDDQRKSGKRLEGIEIFPSENLRNLLETNTVAHVILSIQNLAADRKKEIIESCLSFNTKVLNVPPVARWINGELSFKQIKKIRIEDLLGRDEIKLDEVRVSHDLADKTVIVTGAAGSIGSELVRQIAHFPVKRIILIDQAESPLYLLELECLENYHNTHFEFILANVCNKSRMEDIFRQFNPDILFHAAAYKHVPMMEENPGEAVENNVLGTKILADLSVKWNLSKFIMVSTDKAVNPTNVMGATKRIAEIYVQSLNDEGKTKFITTRFGNVLGSNGSVIPLFSRQIENGGPVTITHPDITRYFMTIPEACRLVLEAGTMGEGGEIFIFDMGKSMKIVDLAHKMIKLSGQQLGRDIQISYTGLRPGEKLYEELLNDKENTIPTYHPLITIARVRKDDPSVANQEIDKLISISAGDEFELVKKMKTIVPEFRSQNSRFEQLDA